MSFEQFSYLVKERFDQLSQHELFVTVSGDELWDRYLAAFPDGTNEIYRERRQHDCSCCRGFIKNLGNVVAIINGELQSVWDVKDAPYPYNIVAQILNEFVVSHPITTLFRTREIQYGVEYNFERHEDGHTKKWNHFWGRVHSKHRTSTPDKARGDHRTRVQTLERALTELTPTALETVLELIDSKALYRGEEHQRSVVSFIHLQREFSLLTGLPQDQNLFLWFNANSTAAHFRNSVIGTLVQDLSEGKDLEYAVKSFEQKVAPANYKRPTALITQGMIKTATATIAELGLEAALERRLARLSDVSITDVLWASNAAKSKMQGSLETLLAGSVKTKSPTKAQDITIDAFMADVVPNTKAMSVFVKNSHRNNLMVLTAPVHADSERLFKWDNGFAWSYSGNMADSIKERVKKAGGKVEGYLCCRLAWDYEDDLDFHMYEPNGHHIFFSNRRSLSQCGGMLDLDANGIDGIRKDPAENIFYADRKKMQEGVYTLQVNNYSRRSDGVGFEVEIEFDGQIHSFPFDQVLKSGNSVTVAILKYTKVGGIEILESLPSSARSQSMWGIASQDFVDVSTLMLSPNHWNGQALGNKHYFFVLDGCRSDEKMRGIYNEFLRGELDQHRKVFEILGSKTYCVQDPDGMAGLGFSSTRNDEVIIKCDNRLYNVKF